MLVITHWRPVPLLKGPGFAQVLREIQALRRLQVQKARRIRVLRRAELYYNEVGPELVSLDQVDNYAAIDTIGQEPLNTEIGLRLLNLGLGVQAVEYLQDIRELQRLQTAYQELFPGPEGGER